LLGPGSEPQPNRCFDYGMLPAQQLWQDGLVPRKKRSKKFRAIEVVKALARERIGSPPTSKVVPNQKRKPQKHKPTLGQMLEEKE
jgi:hypothetical protein